MHVELLLLQDEALEILKGYKEKIDSGDASFDDLASEYSDCSSARNKGDLGPFGRGQMQVSFDSGLDAIAKKSADLVRKILNTRPCPSVDAFNNTSILRLLEMLLAIPIEYCRNLSRMLLSLSKWEK